MKQTSYFHSLFFLKGLFPLAFVTLFLLTGCKKNEFITAKNDLKDFGQTNLVANNNEYNAARVAPKFQNAWGLAFATSGVPWVNTEATGLSYVLTAAGADARPPVLIPSPTDTMGGAPSGIIFNGTTGFKLTNKNPARFIFVGTDGVISGWNGGNKAERVMNNSASASYTGLAIGASNGKNYIYAANFRKAMIEVYDSVWGKVSMAFKDPALPSGYSPFNIQAIDKWLFVMYAAQDPTSPDDELHGAGKGFVDIFATDGSFVARFISRGELNAPWGIALAPEAFFEDMKDMKNDNNGNDMDKNMKNTQIILVGNFGDGRINAYNMAGVFLKALQTHNKAIVIEGLWAIAFPPSTSTNGVDPNALYFTAGPDDEKDGLYGYIKKTN
ncbi:TIGR03118 family protein [Pinibacter soli]|uniref:TIGR03118 family protein n=1 Tax=Pinibacter soli TaxID=3044211 RepID=A0ABT6RFE3_9BACT|nr:TIGR03118 family protein [Pinibacter soli]MDI3320609.1 TIGR03118 family protein [Pinibacter soli]